MPTSTKIGYSFVWQKEDGTVVTSTTQNTTIGDHTLTGSLIAKTYSVTSGANIEGVTVTVNSTGTFDSDLSISTSGSATGYDYTFTDIKVYSGTSTSGTLLATYTSTSATFTMTGTYYDDIYVYATWSRTAIATTIYVTNSLFGNVVTYKSGSGAGVTIKAAGGGGKWTYSVVDAWCNNVAAQSAFECYSLSPTGETTDSAYLRCFGDIKSFPILGVAEYRYLILATSVYNGTTASIEITFQCTRS